jgi:hypothetical protein
VCRPELGSNECGYECVTMGFGGRGKGDKGGAKGKGFGGRGKGFGGFAEGPPDSVVEIGMFVHPCEGELVVKSTNEKACACCPWAW